MSAGSCWEEITFHALIGAQWNQKDVQIDQRFVIMLAQKESHLNGARRKSASPLLFCWFACMLATDSIEVHDTCYLVRVGSMGRIGRFQVVMAAPLNRRERVVCRTSRGLEVGNILGPAQMAFDEAWPSSEAPGRRASMEFDGRIIRKLTAEDELLWKQLQLLGSAAYSACEAWLVDHAIQTTLLEVEPLLDGRTLYFHFLNEVTAEVQSHLDELVAIYEAQVRQSKFAQLLEHGCGPGCGTEKALNGCGTRGGCAVCSIAAQCKSSDKSNRSH